jgi:hypothetical protein
MAGRRNRRVHCLICRPTVTFLPAKWPHDSALENGSEATQSRHITEDGARFYYLAVMKADS